MNPISWTVAQRLRLRRAVRNFNRRVERLAKRAPEGVQVPAKLVYAQEKANITNRNQLYRRIAQLERFAGVKEPIVTRAGKRIYKWAKDEITRIVRRENKRRDDLLRRAVPDFSSKTLPEQLSELANRDLAKLRVESFYGKGGLERLREYYNLGYGPADNLISYLRQYQNELLKYSEFNPDYLTAYEIIDEMIARGLIAELAALWDEGHIELQIFFTYQDSPDRRAFADRSGRIARFWEGVAARYGIEV